MKTSAQSVRRFFEIKKYMDPKNYTVPKVQWCELLQVELSFLTSTLDGAGASTGGQDVDKSYDGDTVGDWI